MPDGSRWKPSTSTDVVGAPNCDNAVDTPMSDKLPKVSIAVVGVVIAQIGGFIWWTAQQASTIQNLEERVNVLTVENNATDRTNLIRDVEKNSEDLEIIDILAEVL